MKKVVVFGNKQIARDCIKVLTKSVDIKLLAVVGCETGDDIELEKFSLKNYCLDNNIAYYNPEKLDSEFLQVFKRLEPDLCFSFFYRKIFTENFISVPKMGFINIHPSLLPKYRGPIPTLWAMLNNEKKVGVTLHYIDLYIDTGDIIKQVIYRVPSHITGYLLQKTSMEIGVKLFRNQLPLLLKGKNKRVKQDHSQATYFGSFHRKLQKINWFTSQEKIICQIRAFTKPYAGARANLSTKEMIFWKAQPFTLPKKNLSGPGKIVQILPDGKFVVSTVEGFLLIEEFEIMGVQKAAYDKYVKLRNRFALHN